MKVKVVLLSVSAVAILASCSAREKDVDLLNATGVLLAKKGGFGEFSLSAIEVLNNKEIDKIQNLGYETVLVRPKSM